MPHFSYRVTFIVPKVFHLLALALVVTALSLPGLAQFGVTDISPDRPFGTYENGLGPQGAYSTPSGRVVGLAIDPTNDSVLYAASEFAGVWKSTDAAHTWVQSSFGMRSGIAVQGWNGGSVLAVDALNSQRLLFAVQDKDGRTETASQGGLWVSIDGATTWQHVVLPGCGNPYPGVQNVVFAEGTPYVLIQAAGCHLWTSSDPNLKTWTPLPDPPFPFASYSSYLLTAPRSNSTVFGCSGGSPAVFRNLNLAGGGSWSAVALPSPCLALSGLPPAPGTQLANQALVLISNGTQLVVLIADFSNDTVTALPPLTPPGGSGTVSVWGVPFQNPRSQGTGTSYDVFAADGCSFYYYDAFVPGWYEAGGGSPCHGETHADSWAMAFPSTYDRVNGLCDSYLTDDGGVFVNQVTEVQGLGGCTILGPTTNWELASAGLHVTWGNTITGVSHNYYPSVPCPDASLTTCPTIYLAATDNDVWALNDGGFTGLPWQWAGFGLGDGAEVWIDSIHPSAGLGIRNGTYNLMGDPSSEAIEQPPFYPDSVIGNFDPGFGFPGISTPTESGILQVMTTASDPPTRVYDYVTAGTACDTCQNTVQRLISPFVYPSGPPGAWTTMSSFFGPNQIGGLAVSGGHNALTVYALTANNITFNPQTGIGPGQVWRGDVASDGTIPQWNLADGTSTQNVGRAYNLIVNPYNKNELYATDLSTRTIKTTRDGGQTWQTSTDLTNIASNYGEFLISCGSFAWGPDGFGDKEIFGNQCSLTYVAFDYSDQNSRVATLYPGGVAYSRDGGQDWLPLDVTNSRVSTATGPIDLPNSAFYDPAPSPNTAYPSIYLALEGHGVRRLDSLFPLPDLESGQALCKQCAQMRVKPGSVWVVIDALNVRTPLQQDYDKKYRANVLFNVANVRSLSYYFIIDGQSTPAYTHTITKAERKSGVLTLQDRR